jgi:hypothetical protein
MNVEMDSVTGVPALSNYFNSLPLNPIFIVIIIIVILSYVLLFSSLGSAASDSSPVESNGNGRVLGIILAAVFLVLLIINGFNYLLNVDIITTIKNLFTNHPEIDINVQTPNLPDGPEPPPVPELPGEEVYHIPGNFYTYGDSKALCAAYGGRLANIKELQDAYQKGGEWCSYGWSDNQMALFPTQYKHWERLQKIKGHENDCGRPGVNGGYIDNPNVRFGVNCYGHRPKITPLESEIMEATPDYPITRQQQKFNKRVEYWKERIEDILISPFSPNNWSQSD